MSKGPIYGSGKPIYSAQSVKEMYESEIAFLELAAKSLEEERAILDGKAKFVHARLTALRERLRFHTYEHSTGVVQ